MLDIKVIREDPQRIKDGAAKKHIECDVDRLCAADDRRRAHQQELDRLKHEQNETGPQIALYRNPKSKWHQEAIARGMTSDEIKAEAEKLIASMTALKERIKQVEEAHRAAVEEVETLLLTIPLPPDEDVPVGDGEEDNVELYRRGEVPEFDFAPKDHAALGEALGIIDVERGVKLAGTRSYFLKGLGARLHQAVLRMAFDYMVNEQGFEPMSVPVLVREEAMRGTGFFPAGREQAYHVSQDDLFLVGTAEVALTAYHANETLREDDLPKRYVALSTCFRREAGTYGKDTAGVYRIHQFDKVEQVLVCRNDVEESRAWQKRMLGFAEEMLRRLGLPYRAVESCTAELGPKNASMIDLETWMPSRQAYSETHSASRLYDFQARRMNLRYRDKQGKLRFCHTLNNTVIASPRILIPILELNQQADGSVVVPKVLRPHMGGVEVIRPVGKELRDEDDKTHA